MSANPSQTNSAMSWCGLGGGECAYREPVCIVHALVAEVEQLRATLERIDGLLADPAGHPLDAINFAREELRAVRG